MGSCCRFCGLKIRGKEAINLFNNKVFVENFHTLGEIVNLVFKGFQTHEYDELPKEVCSNCANNIILSFRFYTMANSTKNKLMAILKQKKNSEGKYKPLLPKPIEVPIVSLNKPELSANKVDFKLKEKRMYSCYECLEKYLTLRQLKKHQEEVHTTKNLCNLCNVWFEQEEILQRHLEGHKLSKYICFKCKTENFFSQRRLFTHCKQKHFAELGLFKCETCQKELIGRQNLVEHINKKHQDNNESIDFLDKQNIKKLETRNNKKNGENSISEQYKMCCNIGKSDTGIDSSKLEEAMDVEFLDEFFLNQHTENSFEFNECWDALDLSFEDDIKIKMSDLACEILPKFPNEEMTGKIYQYQCPHCKKGYVRQIEILIHLAHDHKIQVLSCNICLQNFSSIEELKMHKIQHLGKNVINRIEEKQLEMLKTIDGIFYVCKYCRKKYKEKSNFVLHDCKKADSMLDCKELPKFLCNICEKEFSSLKDMYVHKKLVHQNESLNCLLCNKAFKTVIGLQYHMKTHEGTKRIKCPFCVRKFLTKINLNAHMKAIHSIVKNHLCTLCDRNFATLDHLKKHVMSVHQKERPHLCTVCGKQFSQISHLKSHFKIHT
ncbi:zinc finger protein 234 [Condylostylus longicornis]|uniref:zinc finger protein 234 n=1 Tax=Condylostylus longicornis TaxID=2530218 RepID=UPI00244DD4FA|nr:zinc finger protein 234 [Condylostylus longicornis]